MAGSFKSTKLQFSGGRFLLFNLVGAFAASLIFCPAWAQVAGESVNQSPIAPNAVKAVKLLTLEADEVDLRAAGGCVARGAASAWVSGESARLEGDIIIFDDRTRLLEAVGHARLTGSGQVADRERSSLKFCLDEPGYLIPQTGAKVTGFSYVKRRVSFDGAGALRAPVEGRLFFQRRVLYDCLKGATISGIGISSYLQVYSDIERAVPGEMPELELLEKIDKLRETVSEQLGSMGLLVDQEYGNGICTKMCRLVETQLRSGWKPSPEFEKQVYVFCVVEADGTVTQVETDLPEKYGKAVNALAIERVKALELKTVAPGRTVPLVIALCNRPDWVLSYVRYINFDVYMAYLNQHFQHHWRANKLPPGLRGTVITVVDLYRNATIGNVTLLKSSGKKELDKLALLTIKKAAAIRPFPDGSHEELNVEFTFIAK